MSFRLGTGCQFAEKAKQLGGSFFIGEISQGYSGGEVWGLRIKSHADEILVAPVCQRIHNRVELCRPILFCGQYHRAWPGDRPCASALRGFRAGMSGPPMTDDVKMEARRESLVACDAQGLFLSAPVAKSPLHGERTGQESNRHARLLKPARR